MTVPKLSELKSRAQRLKSTIQLGKAGASSEFLAELGKLLDLHGLVKMRFEGLKDERKTLSKELAEKTGAILVQQVGHTAVYYRAPSAKA